MPEITIDDEHEIETDVVMCLLGSGEVVPAWYNWTTAFGEMWNDWSTGEEPEESFDVIQWRYMTEEEQQDYFRTNFKKDQN